MFYLNFICTSINTSSLIIVLSNILSFMIIQIIFFWEIASNNIDRIIDDKSQLIILLAQQFPDLEFAINNFTYSPEFQIIKYQAIQDSQNRYNFNLNLIWNWMLPPLCSILGILIFVCILELCWIKKFDKSDFLILAMVFFCFVTEVIFYFTVIYRSEIISDMEVINLLLNNVNIGKYY